MPKERPGRKLWDRQAWSGTRFFWNYLRPHRWVYIPAMGALVLTSLMTLLFFYLLGLLMGFALTGASKEELLARNDQTVMFLIVLVGSQAFIAFWRILLFARASERSLTALRMDTFSKIIRLPMADLGARRAGELASRLANDVESMRETLVSTIPQLIRHTVMLVSGAVWVFILSPRLSIFMMATIPVVLVLIAMFGARIRKLTRQAQDELAQSQVVVDESLQSVLSVKAFCNEAWEIARYNKRMSDFLRTTLRAALPRALFVGFIIFCFSVALVAVIWYATRMVAHEQIGYDRLASFGVLSGLIGASFMQFPELITQLQRTLGATERVREILEADTEDAGPETPLRLRGDISLQEVSFAYPSRPTVPVLQEFNLEVKAGQRVALVGPSGSGKSTTVALLFRLYEPTEGEIRFDGRPARELGLHQLRHNLSLVPQEVLLFGGSIEENIAYGRPGASLQEVEQAARLANAHDFITALPEGYRTLVGERGTQISGGQRQRIAIARAILADPAILILDEATSSLDAESERLVQDALDKLMENRTSIIIAHRLSTVRRCDQILVLSAGTIIERGTHEDLVARSNSVYATLARLQLE
ncbi:MAG: ATP-binding cassette domain-containing protein [Verrucomicrobiales bacterium]|nr:ATP-binding cassette domain-containing protein [Verrucomicrobiales bacterium]